MDIAQCPSTCWYMPVTRAHGICFLLTCCPLQNSEHCIQTICNRYRLITYNNCDDWLEKNTRWAVTHLNPFHSDFFLQFDFQQQTIRRYWNRASISIMGPSKDAPTSINLSSNIEDDRPSSSTWIVAPFVTFLEAIEIRKRRRGGKEK